VGSGGDQEFAPEPADWLRIEEGYGHSLTSDDRAALVGIVETYSRWQPSEPHAPFADDALGYLKRLEKAFKRFWDVMLEREQTPITGTGDHTHIAEQDMIRNVAITFVQSHFGRFLKESDFRAHTDWRGLQEVMQACVPALVKTRNYLNEAAGIGFVEGRQWDLLTWHLYEFAMQRQLPTGLTKVDEALPQPPFVTFVRELQRIFPDRFQRHEKSNVALVEAITVARRKIKRAIAEREAKNVNSPAQPG
jgi:hypothetical protein